MQESEDRSQEAEVRSREIDFDDLSRDLDDAPVAVTEPGAAEGGGEGNAVAEPESRVAGEPADSDPDVDSMPSVILFEPGSDEGAGPADSDAGLASVPPVTSEVSTEPDAGGPAVETESAVAPEPPPADAAAEPAQGELASGDDPALRAVIEAIVYVTEEPVTAAQIAAVVKRPEAEIKRVLEALVQAGTAPERGIAVREIAGGYKMATKPEHHEMLRAFAKSLKPPLKLSLAALETLATIAYKQPITAPEIMEIRGVQGAGVLKTLLDRKLIQTAGRKSVVGKPILYRTTKEFLVQFGLKDLSELPTLKEFEELRRLAASEPETSIEERPEAAAETPQAEAATEPAAGTAATDAPVETPQAGTAAEAAADDLQPGDASGAGMDPGAPVVEEPAEAVAAEQQTASEDANAPGTAPEDSGERRGDEPAES